MPSRKEIILQKAFSVCVYGVLACIGCLAALVRFGTPNIPRPTLLVVEWTILFAGVLFGLAIIPVSVAWWAVSWKRTRNAAVDPGLLAASQGAPVFQSTLVDESIICVTWSIDYARSASLHLRYLVFSPAGLVSALCTAVLSSGMLLWMLPNNSLTSSIAGFAFPAGAILGLVIRALPIFTTVRKMFPIEAPLQLYSLVVTQKGLYVVAGTKTYLFTWASIGKSWIIYGIVLYKRHKRLGLIPDYAFHSGRDAKAFVSTLNAMRRGLPVPLYDWTAYVPNKPEVEGVWPPPIT